MCECGNCGDSPTIINGTGDQGPQGPPGLDGADGADGRGIVSVNWDSNSTAQPQGTAGTVDTYVITYTDATVSYFDVTNGANGADGADGSGFTTENHFQIKQYNLGDIITSLGPANASENDLFDITITEPGKYFISFTGDLQITLNAATQYAFNYSITKNGSALYTGNQLSAYTTIASFSSRNMALDEVMDLVANDVINVVYNVLVAGNAVAVPFRRRLIAFRIE